MKLTIYDVRGRAVAQRNVGHQAAGARSVPWDGRNDRGERVPAGVYFARLDAGDFAATRKMLVVR